MITAQYYGRTQNGDEVYAYTLTNANGMSVKVIELGCKITSICVPLASGLRDVVLGYQNIEAYEADTASGMGSLIGRYANRIENAHFSIDTRQYYLSKNSGENHLHGTLAGKVFKGEIHSNELRFAYISPDGEDGFPGELDITISYTLTEQNALVLDYKAISDKPTIINLTNHSYFNLESEHSALDTTLRLNSRHFTEIDAQTCCTGRILSVSGTPMDFTVAKPISQDLHAQYNQLLMAKGYDHNFILDKDPGELCLAAECSSADKAVSMQLYTTQPALQLYTANFLDTAPTIGKGGIAYVPYSAFCLETQHYPCTPSHPEFPSVELRPNEEYHETTIFKFI